MRAHDPAHSIDRNVPVSQLMRAAWREEFVTIDSDGAHRGFCGLCIARCGTIATVENGRFTRLDPDPEHPTGAAICAKGRAAPELVYSKDRLTRPLRRRRPKGDADPGWEEISWDAALDEIAAAMRRIASEHGPQAVAFSQSSPSTTAIGDSGAFIRRLMNAFGTPNLVWALDLCGWGRGFATRYVYGVGSVATGSAGGAMADIANAGCLILWGYNPSISRLTHATATVDALKRGMKLIVIDPRNAGLTNKADIWLRVASRDRRGAGARPCQPDDRARLVRPGLHAPVDQRSAAGAPRYRTAAARERAERGRRCATLCRLACAGRSAGRI